MTRGTRKFGKQIVAVVVIVAVLGVVGVAPAILLFITGVGFVVWRLARRAEYRSANSLFKFYVSADELLRETDRQWYAFEVAEVINEGEETLQSLPDPPPLAHFALGALYHQIEDYESAAAHLEVLFDEEMGELRQAWPSEQLRRYVETLRQIEREPGAAPQVLAAVRNLERSRARHAGRMLLESKSKLNNSKTEFSNGISVTLVPEPRLAMSQNSAGVVNPPPPIADVLKDVYAETHTSS